MKGQSRDSDEVYMREALRLARKPLAFPYPNPWVGCVIVRDGAIVGRGFHRGAGHPHAEVEALGQADDRARGATLYVNLEPCCHFGRTPPCTDAILRSGIRRVVYALRDPNPEVQGRGARVLKKTGVATTAGVCAAEAAALNEVYLKFRAMGLPFITAKVATSLDGKIATKTGDSKWITNAATRRQARALRGAHQAILTGINTILADNPHLGPRRRGAAEPWRVVLDSRLRIPPGARVIKTRRCIVATTMSAKSTQAQRLRQAGAQVWPFRGRRVPVRALLKRLATTGILTVMVEGGGEVLGRFFDLRLVDRVHWFFGPIVIGSAKSHPAVAGQGIRFLAEAPQVSDVHIEHVDACWVVSGNTSPWALRLP